jgi:hypothetical protein
MNNSKDSDYFFELLKAYKYDLFHLKLSLLRKRDTRESQKNLCFEAELHRMDEVTYFSTLLH